MSLRTLRKLRGEPDISIEKNTDEQSVSESEDGSNRPSKAIAAKSKKKQLIHNPFALLEGAGNSPSDTEAKEDDDKDGNSTTSQSKNKMPDSNEARLIEETKHKNKKKRKSRMNKQRSSEIVLEEDEIDASIREVNKILGVDITSKSEDKFQDHENPTNELPKSLLSVNHKHLNPKNEMKSIFGSRVVHAEQSKKRGRHRSHSKTTWLVTHQSGWPPVEKLGLSMTVDDANDTPNLFKFVHSKQYQNVQFLFLAAVESYNPENITELIRMNPYHVDSLIQLSEACKMGEQIQMAAELIERAIFKMEASFHPLFNITQGTCRLDYRRPENRSLFIALFKHIKYIGQKGCYRTALEFSKLLLSLDPDGDPLGVLLFLDFYAIKSLQYEFIIRLFSEWEATRNLSKLPNFAFSIPMAKFHLSQMKDMQHYLKDADEMLQHSLIMFPSFLFPLLDACNVQPDSTVTSSQFFGKEANENEPPALKLLIKMYVSQCSPLWKEKEVVEWLERNVKAVISNLDSIQDKVSSLRIKSQTIYRAKMPLNISRYVILTDTKEIGEALPQEVINSPGASYDPVPPPDSIASYVRPSRELRPTAGNENLLSTFFRTLMPSFVAEQHRNRREDGLLAMLDNPDGNREEGAVAPPPAPAPAAEGGGSDLRRSVTSLLDAMRDLMSNIHLPEIPRDGDGDDEDSGDNRN